MKPGMTTVWVVEIESGAHNPKRLTVFNNDE